jgi:hypothetical protein
MFPEDGPSGLSDNTQAEMEAGRTALDQYDDRNHAEHEAGRRALARFNR